MTLYSYTFPVKIQNDGYDNYDFTAPYTIISALHQEESHYVGYTLTDSNDNSVEVLNIKELRDYIKTYPNEFTNVKVNDNNKLVIEDMEHLPHNEVNTSHVKGIDESLLNLLDIPKRTIPPTRFYKYEKDFITGVTKCSLTNQACEFLNTGYNNLCKSESKHRLEEYTTTILPPPLYRYRGDRVVSCEDLFSGTNFFTGGSGIDQVIYYEEREFDFSLLDLSYYDNIDGLFYETTFGQLNLRTFNLDLKGEIEALFKGLSCNILDLTGCDFSRVTHLYECFYDTTINRVIATDCDLSNVIFDNKASFFSNTNISELDLTLFSKISEEEFTNTKGFFNGLITTELSNLNLLPIQQATRLPSLFEGVNVERFNAKNLSVKSLTDFTDLFKGIHCNEFLFDVELFEQAETAQGLFSDSVISSNLNLRNVTFDNLLPDGAVCMFSNLKVDGKFTLPKSFGSADNFTKTLAGVQTREIQLDHSNFSKATSMEELFCGSHIYRGIKLPTNDSFIPKNLTNAKGMLCAKTSHIDLRGWNFEQITEVSRNICIDIIKRSVAECLIDNIYLDPENELGIHLLKWRSWISNYDCNIVHKSMRMEKLEKKRKSNIQWNDKVHCLKF